MLISGMSLTLTCPCRLCLLRVLLCMSHCYELSPFQAHWERWHCTRFLRPACLFTPHIGSGSSPFSCGDFPPPPLSRAFLLLVAGRARPHFRSLSSPPSLFIYSSGKDSLPPIFGTKVAPPSFPRVFIVITQFLFFPLVEVSLSRGLCCSGPGLSVGVPRYY
jgi:hypothetical protein